MTTRVSSRLLALGVLWGLLLAAVPTLVMTDPYQLTGFIVAALVCVGTLVAGRWALRSAGWSDLLADRLLDLVFGTLVNRTVRAGGKEDLVVR